MDEMPVISVIVPAHNAAAHLGFCLHAIHASDLPRKIWELVVVDDASTDETPTIALNADKVVRTGAMPAGPAFARNRGAEVARGDLLVFVDADVALHQDALAKILERLSGDPGLVAVFGSYDNTPSDPSLVSQYRNLLHHYAHHQNAGEVPTFWAGCGAVRARAFREAGGFDQDRYRSPQIEDIELGYRLRSIGRILLDPEIQGKHFKKWRLWPMIRTDFRDRAVPWMQLLLSTRREEHESAPSLGPSAVVATAIAGSAFALFVLGAAILNFTVVALAVVLFLVSVLYNRRLYGWYADRGGFGLAMAAVPLHFAYLVLSAFAVPVGAIRYLLRSSRQPSATFKPAVR